MDKQNYIKIQPVVKTNLLGSLIKEVEEKKNYLIVWDRKLSQEEQEVLMEWKECSRLWMMITLRV